MRVVVVTPPDPVVTLAETKEHLRVDGDDDDALITGMIAAATAHIDGPDGWLGRAIARQTLEARVDSFCARGIALPYPPVVSIESVKYLDTAGAEQTLADASYELFGARLTSGWSTSWPFARWTPEAVRIRYVAGYETIPAPIRAAILIMVDDMYRSRGSFAMTAATAVPMSTTVENLLSSYRVYA